VAGVRMRGRPEKAAEPTRKLRGLASIGHVKMNQRYGLFRGFASYSIAIDSGVPEMSRKPLSGRENPSCLQRKKAVESRP
jgi:hypothetical protein